jgi:hypothetical protein
VLTCAIASPLHWSPVATVIPPAVAPNTKDSALQMELRRHFARLLRRVLSSIHNRVRESTLTFGQQSLGLRTFKFCSRRSPRYRASGRDDLWCRRKTAWLFD